MLRGALALLVLLAGPVAATTATVDANGNFVVDGAPFFPIGMYHVSWIGDRQGDAQQVADFDAIADAGFNLVHPTVDLRPGMAAALDRAAARGLRVIAEIGWTTTTGAGNIINLWKDKPAIIGWNIADDFNAPYSGPPNHPPSQLVTRRDVVAGLAPQHLTYASGGSYPGFSIAPYIDTVGVMGFQSYPIDGGSSPSEYELEENADGYEYVAAQLGGSGQSFVANPQSFKWSPGAFPTPTEARNLLFPPLLTGANGVIFYTYWGENGVLASAAPALWSEIKREVVELKTLTPFLLHGTLAPFATGNPRVHGGYWTYQNQIVAAVLNTHRTDTYNVALDLPAGALGEAQPLFPLRSETGMTIAGNQLSGAIGPLEVHAYIIDLGTPGNASPQAFADVAPLPIGVGEMLTVDASPSIDSDGSVVAWSWDFGDGATATTAVASHAFATPGAYVVRLTVRDDDGAPDTLFIPVQVQLTSLCPATPQPGCKAATGSTLSLSASASKRKLKWKWKGAATTLAELGDPETGTAYALCVYDAGGSVLATVALPSSAKWSQSGSGDWRYRDRVGTPGGITQIKLKPGADNRARVQFLADGLTLPDPQLPLSPAVTVQAVRSSGGPCWSASFPTLTRNTASSVKAKR
jgi:hypothetical protein